jgi:hypothetical protein
MPVETRRKSSQFFFLNSEKDLFLNLKLIFLPPPFFSAIFFGSEHSSPSVNL